MKTQFLRRKISRKSIRDVAEQHDLYIEISTDQDKNMLKYGNPEKGFPVKLALYKDHYIHLLVGPGRLLYVILNLSLTHRTRVHT